MDKSQNNYAASDPPKKYTLYDSIFIKQFKIQTDGEIKQVSSCSEMESESEGSPSVISKLLWVMGMFIISIVVIVSQVYKYVKLFKLYTSNTYISLYVTILQIKSITQSTQNSGTGSHLRVRKGAQDVCHPCTLREKNPHEDNQPKRLFMKNCK